MKSTFNVLLIAVLALTLSACDNNNGKKGDGAGDDRLKEAALSNESVHCVTTDVSIVDDGTTKSREKQVTEVRVKRTLAVTPHGYERVQAKGQVQITVTTDDGALQSYNHSYTSERSSQIYGMSNGRKKTISKVKNTKVRGSEQTTTETTYEEIEQTIDGVTRVISSIINGQPQPVYDYRTTQTSFGNETKTRTVLHTPYTFSDQGYTWTVESSEGLCTTTKE